MPGTAASSGRSSSITCWAWGRSDRGLSRAKMRPVLGTTFAPLAPMKDMYCSTCGLRRTTSATAR